MLYKKNRKKRMKDKIFVPQTLLSDFGIFPNNASAGVRAHIILVFGISDGNQHVCLMYNV